MSAHDQKIGFLITTSGWGGLEQNVLKLAGWLRERGHSLVLFTNQNLRMYAEAQKQGFIVIPIPPHRKYFDFIVGFQFSRTLKIHHISSLVVFDNRDIDFAAWTKRFLWGKIRLIYQQHMQMGVDKRDWLHTFRFSAIDCWICPLDSLKKEVLAKTRVSEGKISVVPLPINTGARTCAQLTQGQAREFLGIGTVFPLLGIIGRIDPHKGQLLVVQAIRQLHSSGIRAQLLMVGDPTIDDPQSHTYLDTVKHYISENHLDQAVHVRPFMQDTSPFYAAIDLYIMASRSETYGMVTLEAMAAGVPVIGTNASGTPELLGHGRWGRLFEVDNCEGLVDGMREMCQDYESAKQIAIAAQMHVSQFFSQETVLPQIERLFNLPIKGSNHR